MTAIEPRAAAPVTPWELLARQADVLASSAIIPRQYQGRPEDIIAAGLMGHELGWGVMTSLQLIHVVEGKPEVSAEGMVALIRRAGHSVTGEVSPEAASVKGRRGDTGDEMTYTFTHEDAKRADLAGKQNWRRYPSSMLWARAVSQLARMLFPDVLLGVSYVNGEISGADFELGEPMVPPPVDGVIDVTGAPTPMVGPAVYVTDDEVAALLDLVRQLSDDDKAALKAEAQARNRPGRYSWSFAQDHRWTPHELAEAKAWIYARARMEPWDEPGPPLVGSEGPALDGPDAVFDAPPPGPPPAGPVAAEAGPPASDPAPPAPPSTTVDQAEVEAPADEGQAEAGVELGPVPPEAMADREAQLLDAAKRAGAKRPRVEVIKVAQQLGHNLAMVEDLVADRAAYDAVLDHLLDR